MVLSCKKCPVRIRIIGLIFIARFVMLSIKNNVITCWTLMINRTGLLRYIPWCMLSHEARLNNMALKIPWYNLSNSYYGPQCKWTIHQRNIIIDTLLYGEIFASIPGGVFAEFFGPFYLILYSVAIAAAINILRLFLVPLDWRIFVACEFVMGIHVGFFYPATLVWIARWAPPNERGAFLVAFIADGVAASMSSIFVRTVKLNIRMAYSLIFYIASSLAVVFLPICWYFGSSDPENHKKITKEELYYIKQSQRNKITPTKSMPPFRHILVSGAFWSLNILYFGTTCCNRFYLQTISEFTLNFIGVEYYTRNFIEAVPHIGFIIVTIIVAISADFLRIRNILTDTDVIKMFTIGSHILAGCCLLFISISPCSISITSAITIIGYAISAFNIISCYRTIIDISPNFTGTVYAFIHLTGRFTEIIIPRIKNYILNIDAGITGWTLIILIGGGCIIGPGIIFLFFGQGNCQWWNLKRADQFRVFYYKKPEEQEPGPSNLSDTPKKKSDRFEIIDSENKKHQEMDKSPETANESKASSPKRTSVESNQKNKKYSQLELASVKIGSSKSSKSPEVISDEFKNASLKGGNSSENSKRTNDKWEVASVKSGSSKSSKRPEVTNDVTSLGNNQTVPIIQGSTKPKSKSKLKIPRHKPYVTRITEKYFDFRDIDDDMYKTDKKNNKDNDDKK